MIKLGVILAAGYGSRMKLYRKPKGFLNIGGKTLIEYSIEALLAHGIEKIIIGTGFKSEFYDRLTDTYPQIVTRKNENYIDTGSLKTLSDLQSLIREDFLLLESDILYDQYCIGELIKLDHKNAILLAKTENLRDGVWVDVDENHNLIRMSKEKDSLSNPCEGILAGITKMSLGTFHHLMDIVKSILALNPKQHYDFVFQDLPDKFYVSHDSELVFGEIDDDEDLNYALTTVYPKLTFSY